MRILIISDIHANITALDSVLVDAGPIDAVWCLGDLVGYGPDPNECIQRVRDLPNMECIIGNHDAAAIDQIHTDNFNVEARHVIEWTQNALSESNQEYLRSLPKKVKLDQVTLAHGSPRYPVWEYLLDTYSATNSFNHFDTSFCFVGHTHLPVQYSLENNHRSARLSLPKTNARIVLIPRSILNPGSVGQPRDRDARASYAIYDPDESTWELRRVAYNVQSVQNRMVSEGLPDRHILRLTSGF